MNLMQDGREIKDKHTLETATGELLSLDTVDRKLCFITRPFISIAHRGIRGVI